MSPWTTGCWCQDMPACYVSYSLKSLSKPSSEDHQQCMTRLSIFANQVCRVLRRVHSNTHGSPQQAKVCHPETGQFSLAVPHQPSWRPTHCNGQRGLPSEEDALFAPSHP